MIEWVEFLVWKDEEKFATVFYYGSRLLPPIFLVGFIFYFYNFY